MDLSTTIPSVDSLAEISGKIPIPPMKIRRFRLTDGQSDAVSILQHLDYFKRVYLRHPFVRMMTMRLLEGLDNNDIDGQVERVTAFVKEKMVYVRDPEATEFIISPVRLLKSIDERGYANGDCDDHTLLLNSMLGSIGIKTKFAGVKLKSDRYNHVISMVEASAGWYDIDACAKRSQVREYKDRLITDERINRPANLSSYDCGDSCECRDLREFARCDSLKCGQNQKIMRTCSSRRRRNRSSSPLERLLMDLPDEASSVGRMGPPDRSINTIMMPDIDPVEPVDEYGFLLKLLAKKLKKKKKKKVAMVNVMGADGIIKQVAANSNVIGPGGMMVQAGALPMQSIPGPDGNMIDVGMMQGAPMPGQVPGLPTNMMMNQPQQYPYYPSPNDPYGRAAYSYNTGAPVPMDMGVPMPGASAPWFEPPPQYGPTGYPYQNPPMMPGYAPQYYPPGYSPQTYDPSLDMYNPQSAGQLVPLTDDNEPSAFSHFVGGMRNLDTFSAVEASVSPNKPTTGFWGIVNNLTEAFFKAREMKLTQNQALKGGSRPSGGGMAGGTALLMIGGVALLGYVLLRKRSR